MVLVAAVMTACSDASLASAQPSQDPIDAQIAVLQARVERLEALVAAMAGKTSMAPLPLEVAPEPMPLEEPEAPAAGETVAAPRGPQELLPSLGRIGAAASFSANFQPKQIVDVTAGPATVDIRIFAAGANPQTAAPVIAALGAAVPGPGEISILAHLDNDGAPTATIYRNDNSAPLPGAARVSVRHAAQAPAVQLAAGGVPKLALTNPYFGDLEVPAGVGIPLQLQVPFTGAAITPTASLTFTAGLRYFVYAIGSVAGGTFDFIIQAVR